MQRVESEQRGDESTSPEGARDAPEQCEKQQRVYEVEKGVREVMASGVETKESAIQHVRKPGEWVPIVGVNVCKCPMNAFPTETGLNAQVKRNVVRVIEVDEIVVCDAPKSCDH